MKKNILRYTNVIIKKRDRLLNTIDIPSIKKEKYLKNFRKKEWYDGELLTIFNHQINDGNLILNCGKSSFYDFNILSRLKNKKINPVIAVNACILINKEIILIKRPKNSLSCPLWFDFPAGIVSFDSSSLEDCLFTKIESEVGIKIKDLKIKKLIPIQIFFKNPPYLNIFYLLEYKGNEKKLKEIKKKNSNKIKSFILKKSDIPNFLRRNKKVVFPEILKEVRKFF